MICYVNVTVDVSTCGGSLLANGMDKCLEFLPRQVGNLEHHIICAVYVVNLIAKKRKRPKSLNLRTESVYFALPSTIEFLMFPVLFSLSLSQQSRTLNHIPTGGRVPKVFHTHKVHGHPYTHTHPGCPLQSTIHRMRASVCESRRGAVVIEGGAHGDRRKMREEKKRAS